jgi:hypothetical protein
MNVETGTQAEQFLLWEYCFEFLLLWFCSVLLRTIGEQQPVQRTNQGRTPIICPLWVPIHLSFNSRQGPPLSISRHVHITTKGKGQTYSAIVSLFKGNVTILAAAGFWIFRRHLRLLVDIEHLLSGKCYNHVDSLCNPISFVTELPVSLSFQCHALLRATNRRQLLFCGSS